MGVAAAKLRRLLSCYKENLHADVNGRKVWCLQICSSEKLTFHILCFVFEWFRKETMGCGCCSRALFLLFQLNPWKKPQAVEYTCLSKTFKTPCFLVVR